MPYPLHVKALAQKIDPECWISYSGKAVSAKQDLDMRRCAALKKAESYFAEIERHRAWITNAVARCVAETTAFGPQAGDALFRKFIREIEEGKHVMTPTRETLFKSIREVAVHPKLGRDLARRIMHDYGHGADIATRIPVADFEAVYKACKKAVFLSARGRDETAMPLLKIKMMLHFASVVGPFAPEPTRRSEAYVTFVRELLKDGMIERPTKAQRLQNPGWAYKATARGQCYVKALASLPLPIRTNPEWTMSPTRA